MKNLTNYYDALKFQSFSKKKLSLSKLRMKESRLSQPIEPNLNLKMCTVYCMRQPCYAVRAYIIIDNTGHFFY